MKFNFEFSNLLGTVYRKGDLLFSPDGNTIISPVGNKITMYNMKNHKAKTLPVEGRFTFTTIDMSPNGLFLMAVDEKGDGYLISLVSRQVVHKYFFKAPVRAIKYSPNGQYFAACKGNSLFVFRSPGQHLNEFNPFAVERVFHGAQDDTLCVDWTSDSRILIVGCSDTIARIYSVPYVTHFRICSLGSHADVIVGVYFDENSLDAITISRNGRLRIWEANLELTDLVTSQKPQIRAEVKTNEEPKEDDDIDATRGELEEEKAEEEAKKEAEEEDEDKEIKLSYKLLVKQNLSNAGAQVTATTYHKKTHMLFCGFSDGSLKLYELPEVNLIHTICVSASNVSRLSVNGTGDWVAIGCEQLGQLLVWEWQSETYVMKQQGHSSAMTCLSYSPDGHFIVTGGDDSKVKLWNTSSGFCYVTFKEHSAPVTAVRVAKSRKFVVSASLDGTVRAFDLARYRNFRTFTATRPVQFASLALDASSEFVAAGTQDVFEIYVWSVKVGRLLEILSGHQGPVVGLDFHPAITSSELVSVSWDKTVRVWNSIENNTANEVIQLYSEGLSVCYRPDGQEIAVTTLDGTVSFFNPSTATQKGSIEGRNDLGVGRSDTDLIKAKTSEKAKSFNCVKYSADGKHIIAGGSSKYICIYNVAESVLVMKYEVTQNRSLDAVDDFINRRNITEFGNMMLVESREDGAAQIKLPGVKKGDMAARSTKPEIKIFSLQFSPTGQSWSAATTEGLLVYSLDEGNNFDPFLLELNITPESVKKCLAEKKYSEALMHSLKLNEHKLVKEVLENIPSHSISVLLSQMPENYMEKFLEFLSQEMESTVHFEFCLMWLKEALTRNKSTPQPLLLAFQKVLVKKYQEMEKICEFNTHSINFLGQLAKAKERHEEMEIEEPPIHVGESR